MIEHLRELRDAFGTFMTGVTVVTTCRAQDEPLGFTANSFSSVSLDPPLLLVSIARISSNYVHFVNANGFAVNVLSKDQKDVSNTFARPVLDRFSGIEWDKGPAGSPIIGGVSAWFDCSLHQTVEAGDHTILIGRIEAFDATAVSGLGYCRGSYFTPAQSAVATATDPHIVISVIIKAAGEVLLVDDGNGGRSLPSCKAGQAGIQATLANLIAQTEVEATPGFVYEIYEDVMLGKQHITFLCPSKKCTPTNGTFVTLCAATLSDVTDQAMRSMLHRLAQEDRTGDKGIYFGNQKQGFITRLRRDTTS